MPLSKEEAIRLGYKIHPVQHSKKRRAEWNDYFMPGRYGVTVHLYTDEEGKMDPALQLSRVVGSCRERNVHVQHLPLGMMVARKIEQIGTHPNYRDVRCVHAVIMPTHIHLTLEIPVIKLSKTVFSPRMHPAKRDRILCSQGQMLVLGPWDMPRYEHLQRNGEKIDETTDRAIFQDLNMLAKKMCEAIGSMRLKEQLEEMDLSTTDEQKK